MHQIVVLVLRHRFHQKNIVQIDVVGEFGLEIEGRKG